MKRLPAAHYTVQAVAAGRSARPGREARRNYLC